MQRGMMLKLAVAIILSFGLHAVSAAPILGRFSSDIPFSGADELTPSELETLNQFGGLVDVVSLRSEVTDHPYDYIQIREPLG
jgi:hypothetical protein